MSEQARKDTEEMVREIKILIKTLFVGRFKSPQNNQINTYEWELLVIDQDLGKQFTMVTKVQEDGGIGFEFYNIDNDKKQDIEESVKALHKKMNFILKNSKVFKLDGLATM